MKKTLHILMLTMVLMLTGAACGVKTAAATHTGKSAAVESKPCKESSDRLWVPQHRNTDAAFNSERQTFRFGASRLRNNPNPYEPRPVTPVCHVPCHHNFHPYNLIPCGWLRRQLTATHPHVRGDYYVYALRHIIR